MAARPEKQTDTRADLFGVRLPELPALETLPDIWIECGVYNAAHGIALSWQEIDAFARLSGCDISPDVASCLMDMSRAYCNAVRDVNPFSIAPMERN